MDHKAKAASYTAVPTMEPQMTESEYRVKNGNKNVGPKAAEGVPAPHFSASSSKCKKKSRKKRRGCLFFCCSNVELGDEDYKDKIFQYLENANDTDHHKNRFCLYMCCTDVELAPKADHDGHAKM